MARKRAEKRPSRRVKSLPAKSLRAARTRKVKGGANIEVNYRKI